MVALVALWLASVADAGPAFAAASPPPPGQRREADGPALTLDDWEALMEGADARTRVTALGSLASAEERTLSRLREILERALADPDESVRVAVAGLFVAAPGRLAFDQAARRRAAGVLVASLPAASEEARSKRLSRLVASGEFRIPIRPADLDTLLRALDDSQWGDFEELAGQLDLSPAPIIVKLTRFLGPDGGPARMRIRVAGLAARMGEAAAPTVPALISLLDDPDREVSEAAHWAIRRIDAGRLPRPSPTARFLPAELEALERGGIIEQFYALRRICLIGGPDAAPAVPTLLRFVARYEKSENPFVTEAAPEVSAMFSRPIFGDALLPALIDQIRDDQPQVAETACVLLGNGERSYADMVPAMRAKVGQVTGAVRGQAAMALGSIGRDDPAVLADLVRLYRDATDPKVRAGVVEGLQGWDRGGGARQILDAAIKDADPEVREEARRVLRLPRIADEKILNPNP